MHPLAAAKLGEEIFSEIGIYDFLLKLHCRHAVQDMRLLSAQHFFIVVLILRMCVSARASAH